MFPAWLEINHKTTVVDASGREETRTPAPATRNFGFFGGRPRVALKRHIMTVANESYKWQKGVALQSNKKTCGHRTVPVRATCATPINPNRSISDPLPL